MADINVERKRGSVWIWVVGLLVTALLIWAFAELFDGQDEGVEETAVEAVGANPAPPPPAGRDCASPEPFGLAVEPRGRPPERSRERGRVHRSASEPAAGTIQRVAWVAADISGGRPGGGAEGSGGIIIRPPSVRSGPVNAAG